MVTVDSRRTQALIGFLSAHRNELTNFSAEIRNQFGTLVLTSLDSKPISQSARLLLTAGARVRNSGDGPPTVIEPVVGRIHLRNLESAISVTCSPLDGATRPIAKLTAERSGDTFTIDIGQAATTWYLISVERRK
jgi:hypothetical protein